MQASLSKPLCLGWRTKHLTLTLNRAEVTCRNCLDKLKLEVRGKVDWEAIAKELEKQFDSLRKSTLEFLFAHPCYKGETTLENYPPRVCFQFYAPVTKGWTYSLDLGGDMDSNFIQVAKLAANDLDCIATFVGQIAETYHLRPFRTGDRTHDPIVLNYELRPNYR